MVWHEDTVGNTKRGPEDTRLETPIIFAGPHREHEILADDMGLNDFAPGPSPNGEPPAYDQVVSEATGDSPILPSLFADDNTTGEGASSSPWSMWKADVESSDAEAGLCGLKNLGNTCYMNAGLQCISHIPELVTFFCTGQYMDEINRDNPLGAKGRVAEEYAALLRKMWSGRYSSVSPDEFKSAISDFATRFIGYSQHDSQEFLAFLLDALHEDLNRVRNKPYMEDVECNPGDDQLAVGDEAWRRYLARNQSVIVDLFQGQLRSTVKCSTCSHVSVKFDPFMYLSLPIPVPSHRTISFLYFPADPTLPPSCRTARIPASASTCEAIRKAVEEEVGMDPTVEGTEIVLCKQDRGGHSFTELEDSDSISQGTRGMLHAYQIHLPRPPTPPTPEGDDDMEEVPQHPVSPRTAVANHTKMGSTWHHPYTSTENNVEPPSYHDNWTYVGSKTDDEDVDFGPKKPKNRRVISVISNSDATEETKKQSGGEREHAKGWWGLTNQASQSSWGNNNTTTNGLGTDMGGDGWGGGATEQKETGGEYVSYDWRDLQRKYGGWEVNTENKENTKNTENAENTENTENTAEQDARTQEMVDYLEEGEGEGQGEGNTYEQAQSTHTERGDRDTDGSGGEGLGWQMEKKMKVDVQDDPGLNRSASATSMPDLQESSQNENWGGGSTDAIYTGHGWSPDGSTDGGIWGNVSSPPWRDVGVPSPVPDGDIFRVCPICHEAQLLADVFTHTGACGTSFCYSCLDRYLDSDVKECPGINCSMFLYRSNIDHRKLRQGAPGTPIKNHSSPYTAPLYGPFIPSRFNGPERSRQLVPVMQQLAGEREYLGHPMMMAFDPADPPTNSAMYDQVVQLVTSGLDLDLVDSTHVDVLVSVEFDRKNHYAYQEWNLAPNTFYTHDPLPRDNNSCILNRNGYIIVLWPDGAREMLRPKMQQVADLDLVDVEAGKRIDLSSCFQTFTHWENLGTDNLYMCSGCHQPREATKQVQLWRLPDVLVCHLKRFHYENDTRSKIEAKVDFPIEELDLSSFLADEALTAVDEGQQGERLANPVPGQETRYRLFAVDNHSGSINFGHYTSHVLDPYRRQWYRFNDSTVSASLPSDLDGEEAYLLFYMRQSLMDKIHYPPPLPPSPLPHVNDYGPPPLIDPSEPTVLHGTVYADHGQDGPDDVMVTLEADPADVD